MKAKKILERDALGRDGNRYAFAAISRIQKMHNLMGVMHKVALLPILLAITFSASAVSASPILRATELTAEVQAQTCFDTCGSDTGVVPVGAGKSSREGPDSESHLTVVLSATPSISASAEADPLSGGGAAGADYVINRAGADASIHYYFEIVGPQNITIPVLIMSNATITLGGQFDNNGLNAYDASAHLFMDGLDGNTFSGSGAIQGTIQYDLSLNDTAGSRTDAINNTYDMQTNKPYEAVMSAGAGADLFYKIGSDAPSILTAMASIDPSFVVDPAYANNYSIVFSAGLDTVVTTPLPAALPLFATGLGALGLAGWRRKKKAAALAVA